MSSDTIRVRAAAHADAEAIARIFIQSAEHHASIDPDRYRVPDPAAIAERYRTRDREGSTLVAVVAETLVGFVDVRVGNSPDPMHRDMTFCFIVEIAVSESHRSRGIGEALMNAAENWGRERGAAFALLEYNAANPRAGTFYEQRLGYRTASITAIKWL